MGIAEIIGLVLALGAVIIALVFWRRLRLLRQGGIDVALRDGPGTRERGWHLGVGRYRGDDFTWYRVLSLRSGPSRVISRSGLEIDMRREPTGSETLVVPAGSTVLRCRGADVELELAMPTGALTGFLSWLESAPPGSTIPWAS